MAVSEKNISWHAIATIAIGVLISILGWIGKYFIADIYAKLEKQDQKIEKKADKEDVNRELRSLRWETRRDRE